MRQLAAAGLLAAATVWLPAGTNAPVVRAAVCSGWSSTIVPPDTVRVLRGATGVIETVDFKTYVKVVMAAEWPPYWQTESLRAGAVTVKQYAWYQAMHYRGGTTADGCYDLVDNANDQIYSPETRTPAASHIQAVESTWWESITKDGTFIKTAYRSGADVACGADADGLRLYQYGARACARDGKTGEEILHVYYDPGAAIQVTPPPITFHPLTPARILDTRSDNGLPGAFTNRVPRTFPVAGQGGVPADAIAVTGNLTVTAQTAAGYLFVGPLPTDRPTSSTLNFPRADNRANGVTVALGEGGTLSVTYAAVAGATAHVIFDVTGYFAP